ncbi:MAG TPA: sugar nucleotide-binding protein [Armatimonadota bacterium]|jgi:dTDP-4-dehydrorhamnose reductase
MAAPEPALVVGGEGLIGRALAAHLRAAGTPVFTTTRRPGTLLAGQLFLDLAADPRGWPLLPEVAVAYLCAGETALGRCRRDPVGTRLVNVEAQAALAASLSRRGVFLVYTSSNLVYDGAVPYRRAEEPVSPRTEYGRQKAELERRLLGGPGPAAVVRLTKVLSPEWALLREWAQALRRGEAIHPFSDMVLPPVPVALVAEALARVGERRAAGIVQVSGEEDLPYPELAYRLAERLGAAADLVQPMPAADSGLELESVPPYATLDTTRLREELGLTPPPVADTVAAVLAEVAAAAPPEARP